MHTPGTGARDPSEARETVTWYFGDLLDAVTAERPVSRAALVTALAHVHLHACRRHRSPADQLGAVVHRGRTELVVVVPEDRWLALASEVGAPEREAAREVHRRMAVALTATPESDRIPVVLPD